MAFLTEELGDWRNSLTEITETIGIDNGNE